MSKRRPRSDDVLFISALATLLLGAALLLHTTGAFGPTRTYWPFIVMAAGGLLLYLAFVRGASFSFLFGGILLVLEGILFLVAGLSGWTLRAFWPLTMAAAGLTGLAAGLVGRKRLRASYFVPSLCFLLLGSFFALFSLGLARIDFASFIAVWWPTLLIAGGICLFVAYGISQRARSRRISGASKTKSRPPSRNDPTPGS